MICMTDFDDKEYDNIKKDRYNNVEKMSCACMTNAIISRLDLAIRKIIPK